jgi:phenylpropionate dioxygenase-like ring-hydroxylating dioxygenase large terminal subunit
MRVGDKFLYLRNSWYVVAEAREVTRFSPLARAVMNERVVLYRGEDGKAVALADRCPHRFAPLSAGRIIGNDLRCGYHGMTFDGTGRCVFNATQPTERIQPNANVRSFPIVERHGVLWLWPGAQECAEPSKIPDFSMFDHPDWSAGTGQIVVKANYLILLDNLLDLSHINFVHGDVLGNPEVNEQLAVSTESFDRGLTEKRLNPSGPAVPAWRAVVSDPWIGDPVDFWMDMHWHAGASLLLDVGVTPAGQPRVAGRGIIALHCLLPETDMTTRYFYGIAQSYLREDASIVSFWLQASAYAFEQDRRVAEAVQSNMGSEWDILRMNPVVNKADRAALRARRILRRLIGSESGGGLTDQAAPVELVPGVGQLTPDVDDLPAQSLRDERLM